MKNSCNTPFSECWCEARPNHPHCDQPELTLNNSVFTIIIVLFIILIVKKQLIKNKK